MSSKEKFKYLRMFVRDADPTTIRMKLRFDWQKKLGMQAAVERYDFTEKRLMQDMRDIVEAYDELKAKMEKYEELEEKLKRFAEKDKEHEHSAVEREIASNR